MWVRPEQVEPLRRPLRVAGAPRKEGAGTTLQNSQAQEGRYPGQALMALWINCSGCDRGSASARLGPGGDSTQAERARRRAEDFLST